jgi:hypothetical protein
MATNQVLGINYTSKSNSTAVAVKRQHSFKRYSRSSQQSLCRLCRVVSTLVNLKSMGITVWSDGWTVGSTVTDI